MKEKGREEGTGREGIVEREREGEIGERKIEEVSMSVIYIFRKVLSTR